MNRQEIKAKVDAFLVGELEIDEAKISDDALLVICLLRQNAQTQFMYHSLYFATKLRKNSKL